MADKKISQLTGATTPLAGTEVLPIVQSGSTVKVAVSDLTAGRSVSASTVLVPGNNTGITTGDPNNIVRFTDTDTTAAAGQPMGRIEWVSSDASFEGVKGYIQVEATDGTPDGDMFFATQHNTGAGLAKRLKIQYDGDVNVLTGNLVVGTAAKGIDFSANTHAAGMTSELLNWYETGTWTPTLTCSDGNFNSVTYDPLRGGRYTRVGNMVHVQCYMRTDAVDNTVGRSGDVLIAGLPFAAVTATSGTIDGHSSLAVSVASAWTGEEPLAAFISGGDTNIQLLYRSAVDGGTSNIVAADVNTGANANIVLIAGTYICA